MNTENKKDFKMLFIVTLTTIVIGVLIFVLLKTFAPPEFLNFIDNLSKTTNPPKIS